MARAAQVELLLAGCRDTSGQPLNAGKVYTYAAGTTTPKATYTISDKSVSAANPIILDSNGKSTIWADGSYKFVIKDSSDNTLYTYDNLFFGYDDGQSYWGGTSGGTGNAHTVTVSNVSAYTAGLRLQFIAGNTSSATNPTLNVSSLGAVTLKKGDGTTALTVGEIRQNYLYDVLYDSGNSCFRVLNSEDYSTATSSISAAGTTQGTATSLASTVSVVSTVTAGATDGVILRATSPGLLRPVFNDDTGDILKVYPPTGGQINTLATNAAYSMPPNTRAIFASLGSNAWKSLLGFPEVFTSWTPTYSASGSMTFTSVTTRFAYYIQLGKIVIFMLNAGGTTGGTASNELRATLPVTAAAGMVNFAPCSGYANDSGTESSSNGYLQSSTVVAVRKNAADNWGLGGSRSFGVLGIYEAA